MEKPSDKNTVTTKAVLLKKNGSCFILCKKSDQTDHKENENDHGQNVGHIGAHPICDLETPSLVGFRGEFLPAPAVAADAEDSKHQGTQRQKQVADQEILQVHNGASLAKGGNAREQVEAQHAGQRQQKHGNAVDQASLLFGPARHVAGAGDDIFKYCKHGGEGGKGEEDEEKASPKSSQGEVVKDVGQSYENEVGTAVHLHAVGEAGRENDQTRGDGNKGIQHRHVDRLAKQSAILAKIASKDRHGANSKAQGKEGLGQSTHDDIAPAYRVRLFEVGEQIELQTFGGTVHEESVDGKHHHDHEKRAHHDLGHLLQALLQAEGADRKAKHHHDAHIDRHGNGIRKHLAKMIPHSRRIQARKVALGGGNKVADHPARNRGVEHHENIVARQRKIAVNMPFTALGLQLLIEARGALLCRTSQSKFHGQNGNSHEKQKREIEEHEDRATVLSRHVGELPHVANADGASCAEQNKAETASQMLAGRGLFFVVHFVNSFFSLITVSFKTTYCIIKSRRCQVFFFFYKKMPPEKALGRQKLNFISPHRSAPQSCRR